MTILDRITSALDAQSLVTVTALIRAGEEHVSAGDASEAAAVDYLNLLEALAKTVNAGLVGPATSAEIEVRVVADLEMIEDRYPGLRSRAKGQPTDFCEIEALLQRSAA